MKLKFLGKTRPSYFGAAGRFGGSGATMEVPEDKANYLLENFSDDFEVVSDSEVVSEESPADSSSEEESSSDDEDSSEDRKEILDILSDGATLKITEIASKMGVAWQSIRSEINGLMDDGKISRNSESQYHVV
tara:strand:- start:2095 stop:2493 length:399 start_codon:yes stop_codon:yes gene_type:complete